VPEEQVTQDAALNSAYLPASQETQVFPSKYVPGLQPWQPVKSEVDALPIGQDVQVFMEPRLYFPSSQAAHADLSSFTREPAPQVRQLDALAALYEPVTHGVHVDVPPTENLPALHASQASL
jgi:hypothetical protein